MFSTRSLTTACALFATALALPTPPADTTDCSISITPEQLTAIDPNTASCTGAAFPAECADASTAAPAISAAFAKYGITEPGVQAALLGIMLYESGSFKFNHNHFPTPGRPGQGTRNMQMAPFNEKYAATLFDADAIAKAKAGAGSQDPTDAVLALINANAEDSFGSAAWYLTTQCPASIQKGLEDGSSAGWDAYLVQCVKTTHDAGRDPSWTAAKKVLGA